MDLRRAANKFNTSPVYVWDTLTADWIPTGKCGALQAFDRFVTERTFGQMKRIMLLDPDDKLEDDTSIIKLEGSEKAFLVEKFNEDVRRGGLYSYVYLLHEAPFYVDVQKETFTENAAGVNISNGQQIIESTWVDISRFSGAPSRKFEETEYTILTMTFPSDSIVDTDCHLITSKGDRYNVDEIYYSLDLITARGKRIGS